MVRHYLQESLYAKERVAKLFTIGPMFRHERPQKGRFREFHQIDVEVFGVEEALVDAELVWMIFLMLNDLGVKHYTIEVNSVGCKQCRGPFRDVLVQYFEAEKDHLCEDCLRRLNRNPLRIFDCKNAQCIQIAAGSPLLYDHLCGACRDHLGAFLHYMDEYGVAVAINKRLVRGLDYYTKTVFEITSEDLGAQKAFMAGGRYNNLVEEMGGPATAGIGFAIGVERLSMLTHLQNIAALPACFFAYVGEKAKHYLIPILRAFATEGLTVRYSYEGKSLKAQMRYADNVNADFVLILGDEEIEKGIIILRNMKDKTQQELPLDPQSILHEFRKYV
jgi:histidyl-tRNA synthetase